MNGTRRVPQRPGFRIRNSGVRFVLETRLSGLFLLLLGLGIGLNGVAAPTRVTVLPITTEDHSYRSWRGAVDLGDVVVANLGSVPEIVLVERADLNRIESERALASAGLASAQGIPPLQGAEWGVAVRLGEAQETRRPLRIDVIDLARGQTLFQTNQEVVVPLRSRLSGDAALAGEIASRVRDALAGARQVERSQAGLRRVVWFTTPLGSAPSGCQFVRPEPD